MADTVTAAKVQLVDHGWIGIKKQFKELKTHRLTIGFQGKSGAQLYPEGINVASVATYQEFGTGHGVPARPFLRAAMFEHRDKIARLYAIGLARLVAGKITVMKLLAGLGAAIVKLVERKIESSRAWAKPNSPATNRPDFPLHDTDLMSKSVTWAIRGKSGDIISTGGASNG